MKITLIAILLVSCSLCQAQSFAGKTNSIVLNLKNPTPARKTDLPMITWITPKLEFVNSQNANLLIEATVFTTQPLKSLRVSIGDGNASRGEKAIEIQAGQTIHIKQSIRLMDGTNMIQIIAENESGGAVTSSRSVMFGKDALTTAISVDRKDYVLMFATDQYDHWNDLVNPVDDAQSIAKVLREKYGFEVEIVENPNQDDVYNKLRDYAERRFKPQDQLMIFFAGHGYFDDTFGEGFVVAKNSLENDKAKTSYISHNRLRGILQNIPSEHIFLAMDVCFGGTFDPIIAGSRGMDAAAESSNSDYLVRKFGQRTRKYLTSGGKEYVSDGIPGKHSPFTLKLLEALSAGGGSDRILTLAEIKTYVEKLKPEPRLGSFGDDKAESDFVFISKN